jgi:hypothetical protein
MIASSQRIQHVVTQSNRYRNPRIPPQSSRDGVLREAADEFMFRRSRLQRPRFPQSFVDARFRSKERGFDLPYPEPHQSPHDSNALPQGDFDHDLIAKLDDLNDRHRQLVN